jgi:hypothetical protein
MSSYAKLPAKEYARLPRDMQTLKDVRPGLNPIRLKRLMKEAIDRCELDLTGLTVLTEAATGSYMVTPVLAAMAGASRVLAVARTNRYGTAQETSAETEALAALAGQGGRIEFIPEVNRELVHKADVVTNSGNVRPITAEFIGWMRTDAVIPLMYETWEFRASDVDLEACGRRGIAVAGTNECHPAIEVFSFLGMLAAKLLFDAGIGIHKSRLLLLCDNSFLPHIESALNRCGAFVHSASSASGDLGSRDFDAVIVAMKPRPGSVISLEEMRKIAAGSPGVVLLQYYGDVDRALATAAGVIVWPEDAPAPGHMGILQSAIGPEATIRLQAGGLKAGEVLYRRSYEKDPAAAQFIQPVRLNGT